MRGVRACARFARVFQCRMLTARAITSSEVIRAAMLSILIMSLARVDREVARGILGVRQTGDAELRVGREGRCCWGAGSYCSCSCCR